MDTKRKEQIDFRAGSTRDGLIANYVPTKQAFMYEKGFKDGANWSDENPKEGFVSLDQVCSIWKRELMNTLFEIYVKRWNYGKNKIK